ncbi:iron ABC transporter ATP-binding protein [Pasteurellaceae bacterium Orientalotternb1]|nr:iron ABC transporter ATP-binding protein [Pasteurellaceae bacterium Orientalotternb1]
MSILIETNDLTIGYQGKRLVSQINFQLKPQQICCLLGANGAGKSTFLKTLLGLLPPHSGQISFNQRPLNQWSQLELAKQIAYVPQAHQSLFAFSVLDMVLMGRSAYLKWYQHPQPQDKQLALAALSQLEIEHLAHRDYAELSGGEKQLVLIARAIAQDASLLIMDEPTSSLDFGNQIRILEKINALRASQRTFIITTHAPQQADYLTTSQDTIIILDKNLPLAFEQGSKSTMLNLDKLAQIYHIAPNTLAAHLHLRETKNEHFL